MNNFSKQLLVVVLTVATTAASYQLNAMKRDNSDSLEQIAAYMKATGDVTNFEHLSDQDKKQIALHIFDSHSNRLCFPDVLASSIQACNLMTPDFVAYLLQMYLEQTGTSLCDFKKVFLYRPVWEPDKTLQRCNKDSTVLHYACKNGCLFSVKIILQIAGDMAGDLICSRNGYGLTPLHKAVYKGNENIVNELLGAANKLGITWKLLSTQASGGCTALHTCVNVIHDVNDNDRAIRMIKALLASAGDKTCDLINIKSKGQKASELAASKGHVEIASLLNDLLNNVLLEAQKEDRCFICYNDYDENTVYLLLPCCSKLICLDCGNQAIAQGFQHVIEGFGNYGQEYHRCPNCRTDITQEEYNKIVSDAQNRHAK